MLKSSLLFSVPRDAWTTRHGNNLRFLSPPHPLLLLRWEVVRGEAGSEKLRMDDAGGKGTPSDRLGAETRQPPPGTHWPVLGAWASGVVSLGFAEHLSGVARSLPPEAPAGSSGSRPASLLRAAPARGESIPEDVKSRLVWGVKSTQRSCSEIFFPW